MLHHKNWLAVFVCFLALIIAFSALTEPVHAASNISHVQLHLSERLKALTLPGPAGCNNLVNLDYRESYPPINYHGHIFNVSEYLYGWYSTLNDGTNVFCNQIFCDGVVSGYNSTYPPGTIGVMCGPISQKVTKWTGGGNIADSIELDIKNSTTRVVSCGTFQPAGGSTTLVGWGCRPGDNVYNIPIEF